MYFNPSCIPDYKKGCRLKKGKKENLEKNEIENRVAKLIIRVFLVDLVFSLNKVIIKRSKRFLKLGLVSFESPNITMGADYLFYLS